MDRRDALVESFMTEMGHCTKGETLFLQAVEEVARHVLTVEKNDPSFAAARVLARLVEPDRILSFRITWEDDDGKVQINRAWRVQASNAIGPYKGGLRFHPAVDLDTLKFLAFEQCFKNALTGLPLGGAKGGADFDPKGRSDAEIMRFCHALMRALAPHIGPDKDVPAGDINVGTKEIGWLFGAYRQLAGAYQGALTGKGLSYGGSAMRVEATGYGLIYFVERMLAEQGEDLAGKRIAISGKGNVASHAAEKAVQQRACVQTLSDTSGTLFAPDGMGQEAIAWVQGQKAAGRGIDTPPDGLGLQFKPGAVPWEIAPEIALPCATQNELDADMARQLVDGGTRLVAEGANMPLTAEAVEIVTGAGLAYAPGKAANAGGVAVSGLEMSQMSHRQFMSAEEVDRELCVIMRDLHARVAEEGREPGGIDYVRGANVAGYRRLAQAISAQGII
ncbi:NADP-specific glutamate dehydrogenase [Pseudoponticoccus marisrubri]|uniref:Glutamate dehydrogenase n=1 Tax=Pseudoponticoccus marisrubri TaxID=1685382 RepID=A0A0W7WJ66_9RHOB|nr:NADP-specific glutamate dehydrogenase [Pseudoponticoccus marisrubri]KUF10590.1 glutamate dehydrogenase [Pseudoponticoccus marisrubri]